jgi:signal transduction histidine kinase
VHAQGRELIVDAVANPACDASAMVRVDRQQLYRVLQNLIDNAMKFSPDPTTPIVFTSSIRQSADDVTLYEWYVAVEDAVVLVLPKKTCH